MSNDNNIVNESITRILKEVSTMQINARVRNLEAQFNRQFAPLGLSQMMLGAASSIATIAESMLVADQQARTRLMIAPNRRGPREIALNPTSVSRAGLRLRYDVMVQVLHGRKLPGSPPIAAGQFRNLRLAMHYEALKLLPSFQVIAPKTTCWD
ncbi:hypothetical protein [Parasitella parasitica]|uniref:Uncharacterized protein n=1 Tax=Parasitella parasitica TaxID=35722 RepID=A0A0B7NSP8_9FUNG|nr:hypothetical protein [Parasitella parasitica]